MSKTDLMVAIDPGVNGCGLSVWDGELLISAMYTGSIGGLATPLQGPAACCREIFETIGRFDLLLIEVPQIYQTSQQKGDQRDLVRLAIVAGCIIQASWPLASSALEVLPHDWKGNTPKTSKDGKTIIMERHMRRTLMDEEIETIALPKAKSLHHNVWDAVALGAWRVGRRPLDGQENG